jgi:hypothetical protein
MQRRRKGGGKAVQPHLERSTVEVREFEKEAVASRGVDSTIEIEIVELVRHGGPRLARTRRNPPPDEGEYA